MRWIGVCNYRTYTIVYYIYNCIYYCIYIYDCIYIIIYMIIFIYTLHRHMKMYDYACCSDYIFRIRAAIVNSSFAQRTKPPWLGHQWSVSEWAVLPIKPWMSNGSMMVDEHQCWLCSSLASSNFAVTAIMSYFMNFRCTFYELNGVFFTSTQTDLDTYCTGHVKRSSDLGLHLDHRQMIFG
jgi:hypothetical protein